MKPKKHTFPYFARITDLEQCLDILGKRPLKLIAPSYFSNKGIHETQWNSPEWGFFLENNGASLEKPILVNEIDTFQFSIANNISNQDWHYHQHTFEIYVSEHSMVIEFLENPSDKYKKEFSTGESGILIVPPGLPHKATLNGLTFVFQASLGGNKIGNDKILVEEPRELDLSRV